MITLTRAWDGTMIALAASKAALPIGCARESSAPSPAPDFLTDPNTLADDPAALSRLVEIEQCARVRIHSLEQIGDD